MRTAPAPARPDQSTADPSNPEKADRWWLVRAVPALMVGIGLVAMTAALFIADQSGVSRRESAELAIGPVHVLIVYTAPSLTMVIAGVLSALALVVLVHGVERLAGHRVTN